MQKVVVIHCLTLWLGWFALLLRLLGWRVEYMDVSGRASANRWIVFFRALGVFPADYSKFKDCDVSAWSKLEANFASNALREVSKDKLMDVFYDEMNADDAGKRQKARILLFRFLCASSYRLAKTFSYTELCKQVYNKVYVVYPVGILERLMLQCSNLRLHNLFPSPLYAFGSGAKLTRRGWGLLRSRILNGLAGRRNKQVCRSDVPEMDAPVLFFPHKGVEYGNLFIKDVYYSSDERSPFHPSRIMHVELADKISADEQRVVERSYQRLGLKYRLLGLSRKAALKSALRFSRKALRLPGRSTLQAPLRKLRIFSLLLSNAAYTKTCLDMTSGLGAAKIALVGYDYLFPVHLAFALQERGVKVVAVQERFLQVFFPQCSYMFDVYFVYGPIVKDMLQDSDRFSIDHILPVGNYRGDKLLACMNDEDLIEKVRKRIAHDKVVTVLDFHSTNMVVEESFVNRANNKKFYMDILALALSLPDTMFIVRGKNSDWRSMPFFDDVREIMDMAPNIIVNEEYGRHDVSYELVAASDVVIARHTSLVDECLSSFKPVLVHDYANNSKVNMARFFDYDGAPVFCFSFEELRSRLIQMLSGKDILFDEQMKQMIDRYYAGPQDGKVKDRIDEYLNMLVDEPG